MLKNLKFSKIKKMDIKTHISDIMVTDLIVTNPNTTLDKVKELFDNNKFHHIPVVENDILLGIISKIDLYRVANSIDLFHSKSNTELNDRLFKSLLAEEIMTTDVVTLSPTDKLDHAANLFNTNQFHALPVVKGGKLVGMLTTLDLIRHAYLS